MIITTLITVAILLRMVAASICIYMLSIVIRKIQVRDEIYITRLLLSLVLFAFLLCTLGTSALLYLIDIYGLAADSNATGGLAIFNSITMLLSAVGYLLMSTVNRRGPKIKRKRPYARRSKD